MHVTSYVIHICVAKAGYCYVLLLVSHAGATLYETCILNSIHYCLQTLCVSYDISFKSLLAVKPAVTEYHVITVVRARGSVSKKRWRGCFPG
jgi:hypothetical protein